MQMNLLAGHAPRTRAAGERVLAIVGPCIGCPGCKGLCEALIEMASLPEAVLNAKGATR